MEEVITDREAREVIKKISHVFATRRCRYVAVYFCTRYNKIAVMSTANLRNKAKALFKNNIKLCAGIFAKDADPEFMLTRIKAALKNGRKHMSTEKNALRYRKYNAHLMVMPAEQWREVNRPLTIKLGGQMRKRRCAEGKNAAEVIA